LAEVEEDTPETLEKRQRLVRLLVQGVTLEKDEGQVKLRITYRFDPPSEAGDGGGGSLGSDVQNPWEEFYTSSTNALTLTTIAVK
jgi:hypothetical protein